MTDANVTDADVTATSFPRQHARTRRFTLGSPRGFRVAPDGARVAFLRSRAGDDPTNCLWVRDLVGPDAKPGAMDERIVADPVELLGMGAIGIDSLPPEERARRERAREAGGGIVSYATDTAVTGAVFALDGRLYSTDLESGETARLQAADGAFDPRPSPTGTHVAYVSAGSLRVTSLEGGDHLVAGSEDPAVTHGMAEFIAAEEMRRSRGYWWAPDGEAMLVAKADSGDVARWTIASPIEPWSAPSEIRYPAAGTANAKIGLSIRHLSGEFTEVAWNPDGEWEYLVDADWSRSEPWLVVQTRDQRSCAVLAVHAASGVVSERYRWTDEHWIDIVVGAPLWAGSRLVTVEDRGAARRLVIDGDAVTGDDLQIRRVLCGDDSGIMALTSTDPVTTMLSHIGFDGTVTQLSTASGVHDAEVASADPDGAMVINLATMDHDGWHTSVVVNGKTVANIDNLAETPVITPAAEFAILGERELRSVMLLPRGAAEAMSLPVLLDPYGGPHAQRVQASRAQFGTSQWLADQGFAVIVTDGRGTPGRGPAFERAVAGDLASGVLEDQIDALDGWAEREPRLDLSRVAVRGWSFGGYLAALAVLRRPDRFHAAIAGAPVTDWRLYDTHYTERYLGHPDIDPAAYERCDLTVEAAGLERPLLLIHGLADDNVVAAHTLKLSRALLEAGRPHEVLPLSGVTHMTPQETVAENLLMLQLDFLRRSLPVARQPK